MIAQLFPEGVHTVTTTDEGEVPPLLPEEAACVQRAVEKRRREFAAGRACARKALEHFGICNYPILVAPNRAPVWPPGVVASITHCDAFVGVAMARQGRICGIGVDAERARPLAPDLVELICSAREQEWIRAVAPPAYTSWPKLLFSAKEATYKCLACYSESPLCFHDVEITPQPREGRLAVRILGAARVAGMQLEVRFATSPAHVFTGALATTSHAA
jgi:4'-phosphopantetheinyl transferase EntD